MRVEEMLLIEAEATAHYDEATAKSLIASFMAHRDSAYTVPERGIVDEILFQKRIEFWGEGVMFYDYKRLDEGITRYYTDSNHPEIWQFNTEGRSPQWNLVINRGEYQSNIGIDESTNNPDPSGLLVVPKN